MFALNAPAKPLSPLITTISTRLLWPRGKQRMPQIARLFDRKMSTRRASDSSTLVIIFA